MHGFVAPTDHGWYQFLLTRPELGEVNFSHPEPSPLCARENRFFKFKAPCNAIGGFGLLARFVRLPVLRAWDVFDHAHGTSDRYELLARLRRVGGERLVEGLNRVIGAIAISEPVFFAPDESVDTPADGLETRSRQGRTISTGMRDTSCGGRASSTRRAALRAALGPFSVDYGAGADARSRFIRGSAKAASALR